MEYVIALVLVAVGALLVITGWHGSADKLLNTLTAKNDPTKPPSEGQPGSSNPGTRGDQAPSGFSVYGYPQAPSIAVPR